NVDGVGARREPLDQMAARIPPAIHRDFGAPRSAVRCVRRDRDRSLLLVPLAGLPGFEVLMKEDRWILLDSPVAGMSGRETVPSRPWPSRAGPLRAEAPGAKRCD